MRLKIIRTVTVKPGSAMESGLLIDHVNICRILAGSEPPEDVGRYVVAGSNFLSRCFDSLEEAQTFVADHFHPTFLCLEDPA